ncbi:uncharacterized protein VP01_2980g3 [Puccinia sorghi]|uniref:Reverse transcriptase domain-containing protein n=1 Tax=Puccinia sorghi TaxID=27349 RepID=A0A0L6V0N7_9BASI|nr:uncharacterized protein VP01_2980g3 [Puccinia sorghi]
MVTGQTYIPQKHDQSMGIKIPLHPFMKIFHSNTNQNTFVIFVDFKKAFDRVPHEGLWARLHQTGIHKDLISIIKQGYNSSKIQCRLGCPLSPLPFIIFVNKIFRETTKGIFIVSPNSRDGEIPIVSTYKTYNFYVRSTPYKPKLWLTRKVQTVLDQAMRISFGAKSQSKSLNSLLMCVGLGITPYSIHSTKQRLRLWDKRTYLRTILMNLITSPAYRQTGKTWVTNTKRNMALLHKGSSLTIGRHGITKP